jgi:hypothetical protein
MSNTYPVRGTPTTIRHYSEHAVYKGQPVQIVALVISVSTAEAFTCFFHVHRVFANGQGQLIESGGEWSYEKGAILLWEKWVADHCTTPAKDTLTMALDEIAEDLASWVAWDAKDEPLANASDLIAEQLDAAFERAVGKACADALCDEAGL